MKLFALTLLGLLAALPLHAGEPQASKASIRELIAVTESQKMLDGTLSQLDSLMQAGMKQALAGQTLNAISRRS